MKRRKIVGSSWKMHIDDFKVAEQLAQDIVKQVGSLENELDLFILPSFPLIPLVSSIFKNHTIAWGAQNCGFEAKGAQTGEVPIKLLAQQGCRYVEVGHAERRRYFNENDQHVALKVKLIVDHGMIHIICIGETAFQKEQNLTQVVLASQIQWALSLLDHNHAHPLILAYEPVWAIGQTKSAQPDEIVAVCQRIQAILATMYESSFCENISILYGGSVNQDSALALHDQKAVDGLFVGRFGLDGENFASIVRLFLKGGN